MRSEIIIYGTNLNAQVKLPLRLSAVADRTLVRQVLYSPLTIHPSQS